MPLGASRLAYLAKTAVGGGGLATAAVYQSDLSTDVVSNEQFQAGNHISFAGFNSSGLPVYTLIYTESGRNNLYGLMYSFDPSTGAVNTGTQYTIHTGSANLIFPSVTTENDHANLRNDLGGVSNHAVFCWRNLSTNAFEARAASFDIETLTMTFGTYTNFGNAITARGATGIAFVGTSGEYVVVNRASSNNNTPFYTKIGRTGETLSIIQGEDFIEAVGGYEFPDFIGFKNDAFMFQASANNRDRVTAQFVRFDTSNVIRGLDQDLHEQNETNTRAALANMNADDKFISIRWETQAAPTNIQVEAGTITWGTGTTTPTVSLTNQIEVDPGVNSYSVFAAPGAVDDTAYVGHYSGTGTTYNLHKMSISGNTLTEDYEKSFSMSNSLSENPLTDNHTIMDSNGNTIITIYGRNGSNGYPSIVTLVNPDDLAAPPPPETESLTSLSSVNWNRAQYYSYNMEYVGDDSSGNPVVAFAYVDDIDNTRAYATLVKIDKSSLAITEGTPNNFYTGAGSGDPLEAPILCAEVGSNACAICYMDRNATGGYEVFGVAATLDLDNLTFSFGSSVTVENSSLDSFALNAHVGNGNYAMGNRSGGGVYHLMTRSGNTLSKTSTSTVNFGSGNVYNETEGFDNSGSLYRFTRLNSTGGVDISAGYFNGATGAQEASATPITGLSSVITSHHARLNTSNKGIAISSDNTTTKAAAYEVTWPTSGTGAPSISTGTELTLSDDAYGDAYHVAESSTTDQAYYVYSDSGGNWNSRPITASGTGLTEGSATSLSLLSSSQSSALDFIAFANSNGDEILVGIVDNTGSNAPDIYVRNLDV